MDNKQNVLEELYNNYKQYIFSYFFSKTYNKDISDELTQEVFLRAFKALPSYRGQASFKNWLYVIAKNIYIDWIKKEVKYVKVSLDNEILDKLVSIDGYPEKVMCNEEQNKILNNILSKLKEEHRVVLILRDFQGFSYDEIAKELGWNLSKVKVTLYRARIKFRMYVKKEGETI